MALLACLGGSACSRNQYTKVTRTDGSTAIGTLVAMRPDAVVLQTRQGRIEIPRSDVKSLDVPTISEIAELEGTQPNPGSVARNTNPTGTADPAAKNGEPGTGPGPGTPGNEGPGPKAPGSQDDGRGNPNAGNPSGGNPTSGNSATGHPNSAGPNSGSPNGASPNNGSPNSGSPGTPTPATRNNQGPGSSTAPSGGGSNPSGGVSNAPDAPATIPAGTAFTVTFDAPLGSDTSRVEEDVTATLLAPIAAAGVAHAVPAGAVLRGRVTEATTAKAAGGRGRLAIRFHSLVIGARASAIDAPIEPILAPVFTRDDKRKVGIGAAAGAVLGGIVSRTKKAVGIGAAAGAGGAAAAVGVRNELRLARGAKVRLQFKQPVAIPPQ